MDYLFFHPNDNSFIDDFKNIRNIKKILNKYKTNIKYLAISIKNIKTIGFGPMTSKIHFFSIDREKKESVINLIEGGLICDRLN